MATKTSDGATAQVDQTIVRIREINNDIIESARRSIDASRARDAVAREQDLPIRTNDQLTASEIVDQVRRLSGTDLHKIEA